MSTLVFFWRKLKSWGVGGILRFELECWVYHFVNFVPGNIGVVIRGVVVRLFAKESASIPAIAQYVTIQHTSQMIIGRNFGVNSFCYINALGGIVIGDDVVLGTGVVLSAGRHPIEGKAPTIFSRTVEPLSIYVGNDVWIGSNSTVMPGVHLAEGTVVGAGSVVTKSTEPFEVVCGTPARRIRVR